MKEKDPEKYIIGRGGYDNLRTARPYNDAAVFRIDPAPMPIWTILIYNALFAAFFFGFHWLAKHHSRGEAPPWAVYGAPIGIGLMTSIGFTAIVYYSFARAQRLGPWLIYDKATGRVTLPREGVSFELQEVDHLQYITTKRLNSGSDRLTELNLITCSNGERKRWPLLRSIFSGRAFDDVLMPLVAHTRLTVMRVEDWRGEIIERPWPVGPRNDQRAAPRSAASSPIASPPASSKRP